MNTNRQEPPTEAPDSWEALDCIFLGESAEEIVEIYYEGPKIRKCVTYLYDGEVQRREEKSLTHAEAARFWAEAESRGGKGDFTDGFRGAAPARSRFLEEIALILER